MRKPQVISGRAGGVHPLQSPPRSAPGWGMDVLPNCLFLGIPCLDRMLPCSSVRVGQPAEDLVPTWITLTFLLRSLVDVRPVVQCLNKCASVVILTTALKYSFYHYCLRAECNSVRICINGTMVPKHMVIGNIAMSFIHRRGKNVDHPAEVY